MLFQLQPRGYFPEPRTSLLHLSYILKEPPFTSLLHPGSDREGDARLRDAAGPTRGVRERARRVHAQDPAQGRDAGPRGEERAGQRGGHRRQRRAALSRGEVQRARGRAVQA